MKPVIQNEGMQLPTALLTEIRSIIDTGRRQAYAAVGQSAISTFWNIGRRIVVEEQNEHGRAAYGTKLIKKLIPVYGTSYSKRDLDYYRKFYLFSQNGKIVNTRVHNLEWSHIRRVLSVTNDKARLWFSFGNNTIKSKPMATSLKLYDYLRTLMKRNQEGCNPETTQHWNLDAEYLEPLKAFLENNIINKETL